MMSKDLLICVNQPNLPHQRSILKFVYLIYAKQLQDQQQNLLQELKQIELELQRIKAKEAPGSNKEAF
jgi:hypothetical protein